MAPTPYPENSSRSITILSGVQVYPPISGGHLRTINLAHGLRKLGYKVTIHSLTGRKADYKKRIPSSRTQVSDGIEEYVNRSAIWGLMQWAFYRLSWPPLWLSHVRKFMTSRALREDIAASGIVICDFPFLFALATKFKGKRVYLNTHNVEQDLWASPLKKALVARIEKKAVQGADATVFCSAEDQLVLGPLAPRSYIVPNGIDLHRYTPLPAAEKVSLRAEMDLPSDRRIILFCGSQYEPNVRALDVLRSWVIQNENFLRDQGLMFLIAGSVSAHEQIGAIYRADGFVQDIMPYFKVADLAINLSEIGSGVNVKMLEYIASELPILSTSFGTRGLNLVDGRSFLQIAPDDLLTAFSTLPPQDQAQQMAQQAKEDNASVLTMERSLTDFVQTELQNRPPQP